MSLASPTATNCLTFIAAFVSYIAAAITPLIDRIRQVKSPVDVTK